ncbi:MAG: membrane dipeptidase, partial [Planctomycetota bacterium]
RVAGIDHVVIGSDYDGIGKTPEQLEDVSTFPKITQVLLDRGYKAEQIHKLMSGNALRVLKRAGEVAGK